jgi:hypothetical protein
LVINHNYIIKFNPAIYAKRRSHWPCGLRRRSSSARLLRSWVRIPAGVYMFVCCECCVLSSRGLCDGLITRPEESYRLWRVVVCDYETSKKEEAKTRYRAVENTTTVGCDARKKKQTNMYAKRRWLSGCHERNAPLTINHN